MKKYGKVVKYNGVYGEIKSVDGNDYTLLDKNIVDEEIKEFDNVEFEGETYNTPEIEINIATFVRKLTKEKDINQK